MMDAAQAKQIVADLLWSDGKTIINDMDDIWESPEERTEMSEWMQQWYEQGPQWLPVEPEEVPCGWLVHVIYTGSSPIGWGYGPFLINAWTNELVELKPENVGLDPYNFQIPIEARIRCYIERLPEDQRAASLTRWDKLPFAPIRYWPPALQVSLAQSESHTPIPFTAEFDDAYFAQHGLPIPELKAWQFFDSKDPNELFVEWPRMGALVITKKSQHDGKTVIDYEFTEPLTRDDVPPRLRPRGAIHGIYPDYPKDVEDALPNDTPEATYLSVKIEEGPGAYPRFPVWR